MNDAILADKRLVVLLSGRGSNLGAMLEAGLPVTAVLSNRADAAGLALARDYGIATEVLPHNGFADRSLFDQAMQQRIDHYQPDLVVLAGYMRILTDAFVLHYSGRLINIHPSLLPSYTGLDTHARALADGVKIHGCPVHFVTPTLDSGPIIAQAAVPVLANDTPDSLAARVLAAEHRIYPLAVRWFLQGRLHLDPQGRVNVLDTQPSEQGILLTEG